MAWAEDRATLASDPSADPGAKPNGPARCRPFSHSGWHQALNAQSPARARDASVQGVGPALSARSFLRVHLLAVAVPSPWGALDYASCGAAAGQRLPSSRKQADAQVRWRRPSYLNTPRRPFVTDSLRGQSPVPRDSQSCELTRRFPKRTTSADQSGQGSGVRVSESLCVCRHQRRLLFGFAASLRLGPPTLLGRRLAWSNFWTSLAGGPFRAIQRSSRTG